MEIEKIESVCNDALDIISRIRKLQYDMEKLKQSNDGLVEFHLPKDPSSKTSSTVRLAIPNEHFKEILDIAIKWHEEQIKCESEKLENIGLTANKKRK